MSCSRDNDFVSEAAKRVYALEQQLLSWRKVLRDFPESPTFADLKTLTKVGSNVTLYWFRQTGRAYDVQESYDGISWYPTATNIYGDLWSGTSDAAYFRIVRRPYVISDCTLPYDPNEAHTRFISEVVGHAGGCYDSMSIEDTVSCPEPL